MRMTTINLTSGQQYFNDTEDTVELLSDEARIWFVFVNHVIISMSICLCGIVGNSINMAVFLKQGLRRSVNLSLWAMSLSDLLGLIFQVWHNFCLNPFLDMANLPVAFIEVQYLTAGRPNIVTVRITSWITMYITAERCLSVVTPLKISKILTFERTAAILVFIYLLNTSSFLPLYSSAYFSWNTYPGHNSTKLGVTFRSNKLAIQNLINSFQSTLAITAFVLVIIFTAVLVIRLKQKSTWRRGATSDREQSKALSRREDKTIRMVIVVATVLIVCYTPGVMCSITTVITPDFGITGRQSNVFHSVWSFCFVLHSINSSMNTILYFKMSSKYRSTLKQILPMFCEKTRTGSIPTGTYDVDNSQ